MKFASKNVFLDIGRENHIENSKPRNLLNIIFELTMNVSFVGGNDFQFEVERTPSIITKFLHKILREGFKHNPTH